MNRSSAPSKTTAGACSSAVAASDINLWDTPEHALDYLKRADSIPHRTEGEAVLLDCLPQPLGRVLDLGSGAGRLLSLVKLARPEAEAVASIFRRPCWSNCATGSALTRRSKSWSMIWTSRCHGSARLMRSSPVSRSTMFGTNGNDLYTRRSTNSSRRAACSVIWSTWLHPPKRCIGDFWPQLGVRPEDEDPSNKLLDLEVQLTWLREIGFTDVDCHWKWLELALMAGRKPAV